MGLAIVLLSMLVIFIILAAICLIAAITCWIIAAVRKSKEKSYKGFRNAGFICLAPIVLFFVYGTIYNTLDEVKTNQLLSYNLFSGNYEQAEKLIEEGVSPDCGLYSNDEAKDGEHTILYSLCAPNYLYDRGLEGLVTEENRREIIEFLVDHGADLNKVVYLHEENYEEHFYEGASWRKRSDFCGDTPLMFAIRCKDFDTARYLVEYGADVNVVDYCGFNAAAIVVSEMRKSEMQPYLELLYENGCDMNVETNYRLSTKEIYEKDGESIYPYE